MTCERGLRDYMICTNCHRIFTENEIGIGEMFNCREDIALVCSPECEKKITEKVNNKRSNFVYYGNVSSSNNGQITDQLQIVE